MAGAEVAGCGQGWIPVAKLTQMDIHDIELDGSKIVKCLLGFSCLEGDTLAVFLHHPVLPPGSGITGVTFLKEPCWKERTLDAMGFHYYSLGSEEDGPCY